MAKFRMATMSRKMCLTEHMHSEIAAPLPWLHCTSHYDNKKWDHDIDDPIHIWGSNPPSKFGDPWRWS